MKTIKLFLYIFYIFYIPLFSLYAFSNQKAIIMEDAITWGRYLHLRGKGVFILLKLLVEKPEFRSLFYYRVGRGTFLIRSLTHLVKFFYRGQLGLSFVCQDIGPGLFIQHGFSTFIGAKKIGANCWINQQVTIGYDKAGLPTIGDYVHVCAGAKVIGDVTVGNHVVIGANAVVVKNVPDNCTVVGVPAYIVRRDGIKTHEEL